ncbi:metallophosphoesterase [Rhodoplanes serenus]|uniref:Metallophosphoesterase n=1 Tax=Rhodoplanes serenus TaxID=200615 RepID=A0A9X5ARA3_9BRAD|nr:metallophosphoesterase [Rhodoplanes serenus]MBI5113394.1 metallophosphoesterase [Rhodovulum sp.]MTW15991.1 metallophosphoesterase [Rhodoplanes serenus]
MFVLAHLTDLHIGPLPRPRLAELASKRVLGWLNWRRNRRRCHRVEILTDLIADLAAQRPDHTAVTGDLVNLALPGEFAATGAWLTAFGPPEDVSFVPGNHDAYVRAAVAQWDRHWDAYMRGDREAGSGAGPRFPYVRRRGPVALVGLSSAVPTPAFMATGLIGRDQLAAVETLLGRLGAAGLFRVVLLHHPPYRTPASHYKRLVDAAALRAVLARTGAELVLHGHDHVHALEWLDGPAGGIPVVGLPSASAAPGGHHQPAAYNLYRIEGEAGAFRCEAVSRGFTADGVGVVEIARRRLLPPD